MKARSGPCRPSAQSLTLLTPRRRTSRTLAFLPGSARVSTPLPVCTLDSGLATNDVQYSVDRSWSACCGEEVAFRRLLGAAVGLRAMVIDGQRTPGVRFRHAAILTRPACSRSNKLDVLPRDGHAG